MGLPICKVCSVEISVERVVAIMNNNGGSALPDTCSEHSEEIKHFGVQQSEHKTGFEALIIRNANKEQIRQAKRFIRRAR